MCGDIKLLEVIVVIVVVAVFVVSKKVLYELELLREKRSTHANKNRFFRRPLLALSLSLSVSLFLFYMAKIVGKRAREMEDVILR